MAQTLKNLNVLRLKGVTERTGMGATRIYEKMRNHEFPLPIRLGEGTAVGWLAHEIDQWLLEQVARRDAQVSK
jgi:prophage regulatory protein